jgi:glycosyltransferase involved in cell wall biosynthesis
VDLILAPSCFAKQKLIENDWPSANTQVLSHFQSLSLRETPHPGNAAPILYFGRLSPEKGVQDLLAAMSQFPTVRLNIAGDGPMRAELEAKAHKLSLNNVRFLGHVSGFALESLIAECQFTVFPSRAYETFGKSILESYAHGRSVIASDLGSRREIVDDGQTGILYPVKNVDQLAEAIALLCDRPSLSKRMGETGRDLVRHRYSQEQHFRELTIIYEKLARARRPSSAKPVRPLADRKPQVGPEIQKLRIAYIGGRGVIGKYSGIETYYEETGRRLAEMGHEVTAYCRSYFTPQMDQHNGIRIVRLPTFRSKHLDTFAHTLLSTLHACFSRCEIVHYHTLGPALFSFLPRLFGKKTMVTVQGLDWQRKKWGWLARRVLKLGEWASAQLPDKTIVVSQVLQSYYQSRYSKPTAFVPNGTELRPRRRWPNLACRGLSPGEYVLFLGRFSPEKNCHLLIEAFENLTTPLKLVLAGGSSHTDEYAASLRKHQGDKIKVLDWLSGDALEQVLTNAALFVLPSDLEGLSLALLDAMGAGICVLASDTPENQEAMGDAGFYFQER